MSNHLEIQEALYSAFAHERPSALRMHSPLVSVTEDQYRAMSGPLRKIPGDSLLRYAGKAMTTWGDAATYRYFLPEGFFAKTPLSSGGALVDSPHNVSA